MLLPAALCILVLRVRPVTHWAPLFCAGLAFGFLRVPPPPCSRELFKSTHAPLRALDVEAVQISLSPPAEEAWEPTRGFVVVEALAVDGRATQGRLRVSVASAPPFEAGQRARLFVSHLEPIPNPTNPGQPDLARIWGRAGIVGTARLVAARVVDRSPGMRTLMERFRLGARDRLYACLEPREAGVISGLVLGFREGIPPDLTDSMRRSGTTHLIVISGMHFALVLAGIGLLVRAVVPLRRWWLIALAWGAAYAVLAGLTIPVLRAFSMAAAYWCACAASRRPDSINLLSGAALFNLALDPAGLFTLSFQLSFLAVAAILLVAPRLQIHVSHRWWKAVSASAAVSAACTLATTPLIAMHFGSVAPGVCVANLALAPLASATIAAGFAALAFGPFPVIGDLACTAASGFCRFLTAASTWLADLPGSSFAVVPPSAGWVLLFYLALSFWCLFPVRPAALALPAILLIPHWTDTPREGLVALEVGGGIACVAHRHGRTMVFADTPHPAIRSYLVSRGMDRVDLWVRAGKSEPAVPAALVLSLGDPPAFVSIDSWQLRWEPVPEPRWARSSPGRPPPAAMIWQGSRERVVLLGRLGSVGRSILRAEGFPVDAALPPPSGGAVMWKPPR